MASNGWLSRKRRRPDDAGIGPKAAPNKGADAASAPSPAAASDGTIPASLAPSLGWTNLSACHRPRARRRQRSHWDKEDGVRKVAGLAVFFIHDSLADADDGDGKTWFQGRFFPSAGRSSAASPRESPASVSSERVAPRTTHNSWGLLAVQNEIVDECLTCAEGGYREMDLTFVKPRSSFAREKRKARWVAHDVVWTGGNMMTLATDPYAPSLSVEEPGVKFEPQKLMEGERAMDVAKKYFPEMVKRLRIRSVTNGAERAEAGAMVVVGEMEVAAPTSFASAISFGGNSEEDDGLWDD